MAATEAGVWGLQEVRDKQLASEWSYTATGDAGSLFSMGYNNGGDLGQNNRTKYSSPVQIPGSWKDVGGVKSDGTLWSWGYNGIGGLGQNDLVHRSSPVQIGAGTDWYEAYGLIDNTDSEKDGFGIKTNGTLWAWGYNFNGQLGLNDAGSPGPASNNRLNSRSSPTQVPGTDWPTTGYNKFGWSANYQSAGVVKANGTMWVWGMNWMGTLGQNSETYFSSPVQLPGTTWKSLSRGMMVVIGVTKPDGTLWVWGYNDYRQLGQNNRTQYSSPTQIPGTTWDTVTGTFGTLSATKTDGTLWAWGYNLQGQLGQNQVIPGHTKLSSPVQIGSSTEWSRPVALGQNAMGAMKSDNTLWVWGEGAGGILGQNSIADEQEPVQIPGAGINIRGDGSVTHIVKEP